MEKVYIIAAKVAIGKMLVPHRNSPATMAAAVIKNILKKQKLTLQRLMKSLWETSYGRTKAGWHVRLPFRQESRSCPGLWGEHDLSSGNPQ